MKKKVLVVDDEESIRWVLGKCLEKAGYIVRYAENGAQAIESASSEGFSSIILDITMPDMSGFDVLKEFRSRGINPPVIIITAQNTVKNAIDAMKQGAYDYIAKPFDLDEVKITVHRAIDSYENSKKLEMLRPESGDADSLQDIVGKSQVMLNIYKMIGRVAERDITVLVVGESGTGKELVARAIHQNSMRRDGKMVAVNIAAIPKELLESELFGYEKGAFTGAVKTTEGKIELAEGGTLFLDEVGDIPLPLQVKLLRFLQERVVERIGGRATIPVDVRIVCATHQNLDAMIAEKTFRDDLYYRLAEIVVTIPSLAERPGDAALLAKHFLRKYAADMNSPVKGFAPDALAAIDAWAWPGNVRELENRVKRATIMADAKLVSAADLDFEGEGDDEPLNLKAVRETADRKAIRHALSRAENNISQAAKLLGVSRPTLYDLLKQYDLSPS
jgi:two-component system NtrC family response regulator